MGGGRVYSRICDRNSWVARIRSSECGKLCRQSVMSGNRSDVERKKSKTVCGTVSNQTCSSGGLLRTTRPRPCIRRDIWARQWLRARRPDEANGNPVASRFFQLHGAIHKFYRPKSEQGWQSDSRASYL